MPAHLLQTAVLLSLILAGCSSEPCSLKVWIRKAKAIEQAKADFSQAELVGSWNGWARPGVKGFESRRTSDGTEWMGVSIALPAGHYQYGIALGTTLLLDDANPESAFTRDPLGHDPQPFGAEVSQIDLVAADQAGLAEIHLRPAGADGLALEATIHRHGEGKLETLSVELRRGTDVMAQVSPSITTTDETWTARAEFPLLAPGKYTARLTGGKLSGAASAFVGSAMTELEDGLVYQVMVDRFRRADGVVPAPASPGDRAGGSLEGVTAALRTGYFQKLGVTTLWLSPVYTNPEGRFPGRDGHEYESYHGYWPMQPRQVDPKIGGEQALDALVAEAHSRGLRVILDAVPNHVFQGHPYFRDHGALSVHDQSWFNDGPDACVCGDDTCSWGAKIETCWFTDYLPDLNLRRPEVVAQESADLAWWMERFDLDGLRIDAVPMMPRPALRQMDRTIRSAVTRDGLDGLLLGEVYTGPGDEGRKEIRAYLGTKLDSLDSAFDFPLMWNVRDVIARGNSGFASLELSVSDGELAWSGSGSTIARILGNHDTTRFLSEAVGDAGNDGWTNPAHQPSEDEPYARMQIAIAFNLTLTGLPVLYYGDEVGLAGGGDPDSRRVMPDVLGALPKPQAALLDATGRIGRARQAVPALRRGARRSVFSDADRDLIVRDEPAGQGGGAALIVLSRSHDSTVREVVGLPDGEYVDAIHEARLSVHGGAATLPFPSLCAAVYIREGTAGFP